MVEIDISNNISLSSLLCNNNRLMSLNTSNNTKLSTLTCSSNCLTSLDISNNTLLLSVNAGNNELVVVANQYNSFDLSNLPGFSIDKVDFWVPPTKGPSGNTIIFCADTIEYYYKIGKGQVCQFTLVRQK